MYTNNNIYKHFFLNDLTNRENDIANYMSGWMENGELNPGSMTHSLLSDFEKKNWAEPGFDPSTFLHPTHHTPAGYITT